MYLFRRNSIGAVGGAPGINFQGTATHDIVSGNVGCTNSATLRSFLNYIYFADALGRPYRFAAGGIPEPVWLQARGDFEFPSQASSIAAVVETYGFSMVEQNLNLYLLSYFSASLTMSNGGTVRDATGAPALAVTETVSGGVAQVWRLTRLYENTWTDNGGVPSIAVQTQWMFYDGHVTVRCQQVRLLQISGGGVPSIAIAVSTASQTPATLLRAPNSVATGGLNPYSARVVFGENTAVGRGLAVYMTPTTATTQWRLWRVEADVVVTGDATVEDY